MGIHGLSEYFTERFSSSSSASSHLFRITTWLPSALPYKTLPGLTLWDLEGERDYRHTSIFPPPFHIRFRRLLDRKVEHISDQRLRFGSRWIRPMSSVRNFISNKFDNHQEKKCSEERPAHQTGRDGCDRVGLSQSLYHIQLYIAKLCLARDADVTTRYGKIWELIRVLGALQATFKHCSADQAGAHKEKDHR